MVHIFTQTALLVHQDGGLILLEVTVTTFLENGRIGGILKISITLRCSMNNTFLLDYCRREGGHLAEFYTAEEERAVDKILAHDAYYWIGLTDSGNDNSWKWQENKIALNYTNWSNKQPDNRLHHCALKDGFQSHKWNDFLCNSLKFNLGSTSYHWWIQALCQLFK